MTPGDLINVVVALATVVMAGATYALARVTKQLVADAADATKQADRHHRENMRPFCVIDFANASQMFPFGSDFDPQTSRPEAPTAGSEQIMQSAAIRVSGKIQNKGNGPAKDVLVYLNAGSSESEQGAFRLTRPVVASGLVGAGETISIDVQITDRDVMRAWSGAQWKPTQVFHAIAGMAYEVVLEYKDIFGKPFRTIHPRGILTDPIPNDGDVAVREQMMIRPNRPTPIFLLGAQTVRTLADAPSLPHNFLAADQTTQF